MIMDVRRDSFRRFAYWLAHAAARTRRLLRNNLNMSMYCADMMRRAAQKYYAARVAPFSMIYHTDDSSNDDDDNVISIRATLLARMALAMMIRNEVLPNAPRCADKRAVNDILRYGDDDLLIMMLLCGNQSIDDDIDNAHSVKQSLICRYSMTIFHAVCRAHMLLRGDNAMYMPCQVILCSAWQRHDGIDDMMVACNDDVCVSAK